MAHFMLLARVSAVSLHTHSTCSADSTIIMLFLRCLYLVPLFPSHCLLHLVRFKLKKTANILETNFVRFNLLYYA
jgi:hypothetical protein